jgi:hypothetical protein
MEPTYDEHGSYSLTNSPSKQMLAPYRVLNGMGVVSIHSPIASNDMNNMLAPIIQINSKTSDLRKKVLKRNPSTNDYLRNSSLLR